MSIEGNGELDIVTPLADIIDEGEDGGDDGDDMSIQNTLKRRKENQMRKRKFDEIEQSDSEQNDDKNLGKKIKENKNNKRKKD